MFEHSTWYRPRRYIHFDWPVNLDRANGYVLDPQKVAKHNFYPMIRFSVKSVTVKRDRTTGVLEKKEKLREISYAAHMDSHIYSYYAYELSRLYEQKLRDLDLQDSVLAFRALGKSNIHFAYQAFQKIRDLKQCDVVAVDIRGFFDNLQHDKLKSAWGYLLGVDKLPADHYAVFRSLTKYSKVSRDSAYEVLGITRRNGGVRPSCLCSAVDFRQKIRGNGLIKTNLDGIGIPQGTSISAFLSNVYMLEFDRRMDAYFRSVRGAYYRYCDDILAIVPPGRGDEVHDLILSEIKSLGLEIQDRKTERRYFSQVAGKLRSDKPLQYLGFLFDGQRVLLRSAALARFSERMGRALRLARRTMTKKNQLRVRRGEDATPMFRKKLYDRYSHLGRRNFITYGYRAAALMSQPSIRRQLKPLWGKLRSAIDIGSAS